MSHPHTPLVWPLLHMGRDQNSHSASHSASHYASHYASHSGQLSKMEHKSYNEEEVRAISLLARSQQRVAVRPAQAQF